MLNMDAIEAEIAQLKSSQSAQKTIEYLRSLTGKYETRKKVIEEQIAELRQALESTSETLRSMRVVLMLTEAGQPGVQNQRFTNDMATWECAKIVLGETNKPLSAREIAKRIELGGKLLGEQAAAKVTSGISRHLGMEFSRNEVQGVYFYSLNQWGEGKNDLEI